MTNGEKSLRVMVKYWLVPDPTQRVRVTRFRNQPSRRECYVRVMAVRAGRQIAIYFFRHSDGIWRISLRRDLDGLFASGTSHGTLRDGSIKAVEIADGYSSSPCNSQV